MGKLKKSNILLVGMPGSGKSTVGVVLAKTLSLDFVDTDVLIQVSCGKALQRVIDEDGYLALRELEERVLLGLKVENHVIATGGSAVYSAEAMLHLKSNSICVFLCLPLKRLIERVGDFSKRGIAKRADQSFEDVFQERSLLYEKYADITVDCDGLTVEQICGEIASSCSTIGH